jgi:hypothetical protein
MIQGDSKEIKTIMSSDGMFSTYFGEEFDARFFQTHIPNLKLLPEKQMVWNSDAAEKKDEKLSFLNATTNIELKTNFKEIISKNKTNDIFR